MTIATEHRVFCMHCWPTPVILYDRVGNVACIRVQGRVYRVTGGKLRSVCPRCGHEDSTMLDTDV